MSTKARHPFGTEESQATYPKADLIGPPVTAEGRPQTPWLESTLTSRGQVTIPQVIRSKFQLEAGDRLLWRLEEDGKLVVEPKRNLSLADIRKAVADLGVPTPPRAFTPCEMDEAVAEALEMRYGRP